MLSLAEAVGCSNKKRQLPTDPSDTSYDSDNAPLILLKKPKLPLPPSAAASAGGTIDSVRASLHARGYAVIPNVLAPEEVAEIRADFFRWWDSNDQIRRLHAHISPHGIIKHAQVGHQLHAWKVRTHPKVQAVFQKLWDTQNLVVSFDGACYIPAGCTKKDTTSWTHTDQAPSKRGLRCYQGFVALTDNVERTLVVYDSSHKLHAEYLQSLPDPIASSSKDWLKIDEAYLATIRDRRVAVRVPAGALVVWDSRTFHQNQYCSDSSEERLVQYVSYLPKKKRTVAMKAKRRKYLATLRTTSHWAYPVKVNGLQPQHYGNTDWLIDYGALPEPFGLNALKDEIEKLI